MNSSTTPTADIFINDVTLRDGEQAPGNGMSPTQKLAIAKKLVAMGVDGIEAGFAVASPGDFDSLQMIAEEIGNMQLPHSSRSDKHPRISSLARMHPNDVEQALNAVKSAPNRGVHIFLSTSRQMVRVKFADTIRRAGGNPDNRNDFVYRFALPQIENILRHIRSIDKHAVIQFSLEDWTRTERAVYEPIIHTAAEEGAHIINLPDTVGIGIPRIIGQEVAHVRNFLDSKNHRDVKISWHGHNDTGQGIACAMEAMYGGARQFEPTIIGIGERTGNFSFEGFLAALDANREPHQSIMGAEISDGIMRSEVMKTAAMISTIIGQLIPREHPIVGENAFAHESGIHQHGVINGRGSGENPYEVLTPEHYGAESKLILGKHSGWAALQDFFNRKKLPNTDANRKYFVDALSAAGDTRPKGLSDDEVIQLVYYPTIISLTNGGKPRMDSIRDYTQDITKTSGMMQLPASPDFFAEKHVIASITNGKNGGKILFGSTQIKGDELIAAAVNAIQQEIPDVEIEDYHNDMDTNDGSHSNAKGTVVLKSNGFNAKGIGIAKGVDASNLIAIRNAFNALWAQIEYARMIADETKS